MLALVLALMATAVQNRTPEPPVAPESLEAAVQNRTTSPWQTVTATSYSPCSSGTITASGQRAHFGGVAMNTVPLGTHIEIRPPAFGRRYFTINDRIGSGSGLDIYQPDCQRAIDYGRRLERVRILTTPHAVKADRHFYDPSP